MEEQIKTAPQTDVEVVDIQFRPGQKIYFFAPDGQRFAEGDHIIIDTARMPLRLARALSSSSRQLSRMSARASRFHFSMDVRVCISPRASRAENA